MYKPYYKKVDRSFLEWGFTVPKDYVKDFTAGKSVKLGSSRVVELIWGRKRFPVKFYHIKRKSYTPVYQVRWDKSPFLKELRKMFIQSYVILKSQKELFDISKGEGEHFRTQLSGGQQEVMIFQPLNRKEIKCEVFIRIENNWNKLFERLADENVFGWLFEKDKKYLISKTHSWMGVKKFKEHVHSTNVIYYLAHTKKKLLYIGKAEELGKRVTPGRKHQGMPDDWDKFRYDIVKPEYANILDKIEDHTIRAFALVLKNPKGRPSLNVGDYSLVNRNWRRL